MATRKTEPTPDPLLHDWVWLVRVSRPTPPNVRDTWTLIRHDRNGNFGGGTPASVIDFGEDYGRAIMFRDILNDAYASGIARGRAEIRELHRPDPAQVSMDDLHLDRFEP